MKIIVSIVASENENYAEFKKIWIKNIYKIKQNKYLSNLFDFYFLYSDSTGISKQYNYNNELLYIDFYDNKDNFESITHSLFSRTMLFFEYMINTLNLNITEHIDYYKSTGLFFVRTNLSTAFDFKLLAKWIENKPKYNFFGGSINGWYNGLDTIFSGTNLIFSFDIIKYLFEHQNNIDINLYLEDEAISRYIIKNTTPFIINIKRLDFIEMEEVKLIQAYWDPTPNSIIYHKAEIGDNEIFTFRFKTFNRTNDIFVMNYMIDALWNETFTLSEIVKNISYLYNPPIPITTEGSIYGELFSKKPFKIIDLNLDEEIPLKIEL